VIGLYKTEVLTKIPLTTGARPLSTAHRASILEVREAAAPVEPNTRERDMTRRTVAVSVGALAWFLIGAAAQADTRSCVLSAKGEAKDCKLICIGAFQSAIAACINKDANCVIACEAARQDCVNASGLPAALRACDTQTQQAIRACHGDSQCIEQAQVVGFQCREDARTKAKPALLQCKSQFKTCITGCPPGAGPLGNPGACRMQAHQNFATCLGTCRTNFQVEIDACHHKSHTCVDACRNDRTSCDAPILATLIAAITACDATRDAAIQNCDNLYPPGSQARADCIEQAQVDAFECREDANEQAQPSLTQCQQNFVPCVQACPASPSGAFLDDATF
jgi:hypothetical protein